MSWPLHMGSVHIEAELAAFLTSGNSVVVATRNAALVPHATRGSGLRVLPPDRLEVFLPRATSERSLADLRDNGAIAVCTSSPVDFRTYQLKGRYLGVSECSAEDLLLCERQWRAFAERVVPFGVPRARVRNLWLFDCLKVEVQVAEVFAQTPGPGAGARL